MMRSKETAHEEVNVRRHDAALYSPFTNRASNGEALASTAAIDQ
jgi:hypothetical protein